jgi:hypothetical protein
MNPIGIVMLFSGIRSYSYDTWSLERKQEFQNRLYQFQPNVLSSPLLPRLFKHHTTVTVGKTNTFISEEQE